MCHPPCADRWSVAETQVPFRTATTPCRADAVHMHVPEIYPKGRAVDVPGAFAIYTYMFIQCPGGLAALPYIPYWGGGHHCIQPEYASLWRESLRPWIHNQPRTPDVSYVVLGTSDPCPSHRFPNVQKLCSNRP